MEAAKLKQLLPRASQSFIQLNSAVDKDGLCATLGSMSDKDIDLNLLYNAYLQTKSVHRAGARFGIKGQKAHELLKRAGHAFNKRSWSKEDEARLTEYYNTGGNHFSIDAIAKELNRPHGGISCKASELGLCRPNRPKSAAHRATMSRGRKGRPAWNKGRKQWRDKIHPRGFKGRQHSVKSRQAISDGLAGKKAPPERVLRQLKTRVARYGSLGPKLKRGSWNAGWRNIGGKRIYARSRWEANYGFYLEFLKQAGDIQEWEHEPKTFWFERIKRGVRSYLPDFRVTNKDGSQEYHEVKGWKDARSKTKAKRMKIYHPDVAVVMRDSEWYKANRIKLSGLVPGWEK